MKSPLDSRQLRAFSSVARTGSFTQAARELHLSQSAISHSIKALEEDVGCRILDRLGKKFALTQAGEQLLHHSERILMEMEAARSALEHLGKWGKGRLRIGASTTACQYILPAVLRGFKEQYPQHAITIQPGDTATIVNGLLRHQIDLGISLQPHREAQIEFLPLFTDELMFVVGAQHPWAASGKPDRAAIPKENYILYSKQSVTFQLIAEYFREEDMVLNTVIELGSMEATKELVKLGVGVSVLAPWIARKEIAEGSLVVLPLGRRKLQRHWGIVHFRGRRLNLAEETFVGLCRSLADGIHLT
jgi:DNA-binding transcriptional LysR family regulator